MIARILVSMGGTVAEELVFGRDQVGRLWVLLVGFVFGEGGWTRPVGLVLLAGQREGGGGVGVVCHWLCAPHTVSVAAVPAAGPAECSQPGSHTATITGTTLRPLVPSSHPCRRAHCLPARLLLPTTTTPAPPPPLPSNVFLVVLSCADRSAVVPLTTCGRRPTWPVTW